jgi:hypothetical protein
MLCEFHTSPSADRDDRSAISLTNTRFSMRVIRIFLSTPSDVDEERAQVANLVRDINETVQFLTPSQDVRFELVQYQTHAFPDVGAPQEVIDRQIPVDYDLYLGIMWKRAGTPTADAVSGTVHEFDHAFKHRQTHGWPVIMFFFCDEKLDFPQQDEEVEQLQQVLAFRKRLASIGYTVTYATRDGFRDDLRPRLLRGLADIVLAPKREGLRESTDESLVPEGHEQRLRRLAQLYDETRQRMRSGSDRTREMTRIFNSMVEFASGTRPLLAELEQSSSAGERLAAVAILNAFPQADQLEWLAQRLDNPSVEAPFVGYQAAVALGQAARSLSTEDLPALTTALNDALQLANKLPSDSDRIRALEYALQEATRRGRPETLDQSWGSRPSGGSQP